MTQIALGEGVGLFYPPIRGRKLAAGSQGAKRVAGYFAGLTGNHMLIRDRDEQPRTEGGPVRCSDVLTRTTVVSRVFADGWG